MKFKKNDVVFEVKDRAHIAAFHAAGWQELTEPEIKPEQETEETAPEQENVENPEDNTEADVENPVETVETAKNAKPKRVKA